MGEDWRVEEVTKQLGNVRVMYRRGIGSSVGSASSPLGG